MTRKSFTKAQRILRCADYQFILQKGVRSFTEHFILFYLPNTTKNNRLGLIVSRKAGKSVQRNRIKRVIREYFRLQNSQYSCQGPCHDLVFISKKNIKNITVQQVCKEMERFYENDFHRSSHAVPKNVVVHSA